MQWDLFNEASPTQQTVEQSVALVKSLDTTRPIDACSGCGKQVAWWDLSAVQDFHTDSTQTEPLNATKWTTYAEAHRCGCLPPSAPQHCLLNRDS